MQQKISDAARAGLNPKERKKAVKNRIKKQKIALLRSLKRVSMYLALQCAATIPQAGNTLLGTQAATTGKIPGEAVMAEMNARAQVDDALQKRREWLIKEKLFAKLVQYQNIVKAKSGMDKKNYIKKHFFDVVYPRGGIPKGSNYCVASVMRCLYDVNQEIWNVLCQTAIRPRGTVWFPARCLNNMSKRTFPTASSKSRPKPTKPIWKKATLSYRVPAEIRPAAFI